MSEPFGKQKTTFSEALKTAKQKQTRIKVVAQQLGDAEGKAFMDALDDINISTHRIRDALQTAGIRISQSTLSAYRHLHDII